MTPFEIAVAVLTRGKQLAPDRFPQASREVAEAWAGVIAEINLPWQIWSEAINVWALHRVGDRMATPRDLHEAALIVRDRWEQHPEKAAILDDFRRQRLEANYHRMLGYDGFTEAPEVESSTHDKAEFDRLISRAFRTPDKETKR